VWEKGKKKKKLVADKSRKTWLLDLKYKK
jgi:hypothetical protein